MKGIDFLNSLAKWDHGSAFGLDAIRAVLSILGNPQDKPKSIHVGGTNGKGTVSVAISSILGSAGYSVGLNISPHLIRINERFIINGRECNNEQISEAASKVQVAMDLANVHLTFHEAVTATAFVLFENLDWIVIEVGLGGRLDASNVLKCPEIAIITSISYDHQHILGNTLEKIAREKAGIIKENIKYLMIGDMPNGPKSEIKQIASSFKNVACQEFGKDFNYEQFNNGLSFISSQGSIHLNDYKLKSHIKCINDSLAIQATKLLGIESKAIEKGILSYYWPGRYEIINFNNHTLLLDAAHNPASIDALVDFLSLNYPNKRNFNIIFAALNTKEWKSFIDKLNPYIVNWHIVLADSTASVSTKEIGDYLSCLGINNYLTFENNYRDLLKHVSNLAEDFTVVAGSMYMIGGIKALIQDQPNIYWKHITY